VKSGFDIQYFQGSYSAPAPVIISILSSGMLLGTVGAGYRYRRPMMPGHTGPWTPPSLKSRALKRVSAIIAAILISPHQCSGRQTGARQR
jgi:hypothetical protein